MQSEVAPTQSRTLQVAWLAMVVLIGLNLRPFLTGVGPLTSAIQDEIGLDNRGIAWLTLLPMLLMGIGGFFASSVQRMLGARNILLGALAALAIGSALRLIAVSSAWLIATAALCGIGAAFIQALLPGLIKQQFPYRIAQVMGLYSAALLAGGALGAQLTPLSVTWSGNWHQALAWWSLPALLALLLSAQLLSRQTGPDKQAMPSLMLLGRPRTWLLMICFGLVNGGYASLVAWLAPFYQTHGWSSEHSGSLVAVMALAQAVAALLLPLLAARRRDRRPWLWLSLGLQALSFIAFAFFPDLAPYTWAMLSGVGLGGSFSLSLIVALDHLPDPRQAGALSALMQAGGFLIAAIAPWLTAIIYDFSGGFAASWLMHLVCVILVVSLTIQFAPERYASAMSMAE